jgi:hypothetical protein
MFPRRKTTNRQRIICLHYAKTHIKVKSEQYPCVKLQGWGDPSEPVFRNKNKIPLF